MTNPVSTVPSAQLPPYGEQLVTEDGSPSPLFHRFLVGLYQRTGGAQGTAATDVQALADIALSTAEGALAAAQNAETTANLADNNAQAAEAAVGVAQAQAAQATFLAQSATTNAMLKANSLSDVASVAGARANLGLSHVPLAFALDTLPASLHRGLPILQNLTVPANFANSIAWAGVAASSDTVLALSVVRGGSTIALGTLTYAHSGTGTAWSHQPAFNLYAGDVLVLHCPVSPDATLAEVAFTISASIS